MLEVIAMSVNDAKLIEAGGADQVQIVSALNDGGITPSYGMIKAVVDAVKIPVSVMIRPCEKGFYYTADDIEVMRQDIMIAKELKVKGVTFGTLDVMQTKIETNKLEKLLAVCDGLDVTFNRAIDKLADPVAAIKLLTNYPEVNYVISSGGKGFINEKTDIINEMIAAGNGRIKVRIGGGLRFDNIESIKAAVNSTDFHVASAARENSSLFGEICQENIEQLVELLK